MSTTALIDEVSEQVRPCPCCGERPAIPGLFSKVKVSGYPVVLGALGRAGSSYTIQKINSEVWVILGRFFVQAYAGLPLGRRESPIRISTWIEIDALTADRVIDAISGWGEAVEAQGRLAVDLPGFPGSLGTEATFQVFTGDAVELIGCDDARMLAIPPALDHDQMASFYRLIWGNANPVPDADLSLRGAVKSHWHEHLEHPFYPQSVTPPPQLAGIRPPELLVCPPLDTDEPAMLATVGCSEHPDSQGELVELVTEIRNPSEEYIDLFSIFTWFSRTGRGPFCHGAAMVPEAELPGNSDMVGWLLRDPQCLTDAACSIHHQGSTVRVLEAVPIDKYELVFLQAEGSSALASMLELVDTTDLHRPSVSPIAAP